VQTFPRAAVTDVPIFTSKAQMINLLDLENLKKLTHILRQCSQHNGAAM